MLQAAEETRDSESTAVTIGKVPPIGGTTFAHEVPGEPGISPSCARWSSGGLTTTTISKRIDSSSGQILIRTDSTSSRMFLEMFGDTNAEERARIRGRLRHTAGRIARADRDRRGA